MKTPSKEILSTKSFCMVPWVHFHAEPSGKVYPCCMSAHRKSTELANLNEGDSIAEIWNSEKMRSLRRKMLNKQKLSACEICYAQERNGQGSMRMSINDTFAHHFQRVENTDKSGSISDQSIPYLDIRFSNLCNLRCRICGPELSSAWFDDGKKLNPDFGLNKNPKVVRINKDVNALWDQLEPHIEGLEFIQFAGGEPLLMEEHMRIMLKLKELKKFDVRITYNTNLSVSDFQKHNIFELWSEFSNILIMASLDGTGAKGEYLRKGQNWKRTVELRKEMLKICPNVEFRLDPTVSVQNVLHIPDFYKDWYEHGLIGVNGMRLNFLFSPAYYNMKILGRGARRKVIRRYESFINDYLKKQEGITQETIDHFNAVIYFLKNDSIGDKLKRLKNRLHFKFITKRLDRIRDEDFASAFPEVVDLL